VAFCRISTCSWYWQLTFALFLVFIILHFLCTLWFRPWLCLDRAAAPLCAFDEMCRDRIVFEFLRAIGFWDAVVSSTSVRVLSMCKGTQRYGFALLDDVYPLVQLF